MTNNWREKRPIGKYSPLLNEVRLFAYDSHMNQKYGNSDQPYSYHLDGVVDNVEKFLCETRIRGDLVDLCLMSAYLHDIVEDYEYTGVELYYIYNKFGETVSDIVDALTHNGGTYADYVKSTTLYQASHIVKICDLRFNIKESEKTLKEGYDKYVNQRLEKYRMALLYLEEAYEQRYK